MVCWNFKIYEVASFYLWSVFLAGILMVHVYYKVSANFMQLIFLDKFWFLQMSFFGMVKLSLTWFRLDPLFHPFISSLLLFLYQFAPFAYPVAVVLYNLLHIVLKSVTKFQSVSIKYFKEHIIFSEIFIIYL